MTLPGPAFGVHHADETLTAVFELWDQMDAAEVRRLVERLGAMHISLNPTDRLIALLARHSVCLICQRDAEGAGL